MSKQLTPLEELNKIKEFVIDEYSYNNVDGWSDEEIKQFAEEKYNFKSIETALKRLEEIDNRPFINGIREEIPADVICKKLKAFEIIKRTGLSIDWFVSSFIKQDADYNVFLMLLEEMGNEGHLAEQIMMSEEEFDLLKEVLK